MEPTAAAPARPGRTRVWRWLLPAVVVIVWLGIGGAGGPLIGALAGVQTNDQASFLPASAESTQVAELQRRAADAEQVPAIVIATRGGDEVTEADLDLLSDLADWAQREDVAAPGPPPAPAPDGAAGQLVLPVDAADAKQAVRDLRAQIDRIAPAGLSMLVTGPAGQAADLSAAFAGIDGLLLLVAGGVVAVILVVVYRSPLLPLAVLISAVLALVLAGAAVYGLASAGALTLDGQSQGILFILVFGAATDYALLLVARYREELAAGDGVVAPMRRAWRAVIEPIAASAGTVIVAVLCLLLSDLNSNRSLGPVAAIGIAAALLASITFLPAVLVLLGRVAFWPARPAAVRAAADRPAARRGAWWKVADVVVRRHTAVWTVTAAVLVIAAAFAPQLDADGVPRSDFFLTEVDSARGQEALSAHFPAGAGAPVVIFADRAAGAQVRAAVDGTDGVEPGSTRIVTTGPPGADPQTVDGRVQIQATVTDAPDSDAAEDTVRRLRTAVDEVPDARALVGGTTALQLDTQDTAARDRAVIVPVVLAVVFVLLALLMRALVAPLLLLGSVVLSYGAALGVSALVFTHVFGFPGADPTVPLFSFVFLVALGVDYNIFLMTRVREEARHHGTREGVRRGLAVTGGVITSAGLVLAATFGALAVLPLLFLAQIAFIVSFGVLVDTFLVRSLLVPAATVGLGRAVWWPSRLARGPQSAAPAGRD